MAYLPSRVYNVDAFGAKGDGVTVDNTFIASGLLAATGAILQFTAGRTYIISGSQLAIPNNTYIQGYGATLKAATQSNFAFFSLYNKTGCRIEGLTIDGSWTNAAADNNAMVDLSFAQDIAIKDCYFQRVGSQFVRLIGGCNRVAVEDCTFSGFSAAIFADDSAGAMATNVTIARNFFTTSNTQNLGTAAIKIAGLSTAGPHFRAGYVITDNNIHRPGEMGIEMQTWVNDSVVANNNIEYAQYGISLDQCWRMTVNGNVVKAPTVYGIEATSCNQVAINGDVIDVASGVSGLPTTADGLLINVSSGVSVNGVCVTNSGRGVYHLNSHHCTYNGNNFHAASTAFYLKGGTNVIFNGNLLRASATTPNQDLLNTDSQDNRVANLSIVNNTFQGSVGRYGIFLLTHTNNTEDVLIANNVTAACSAATAMYVAQNYVGASTNRVVLRDNLGGGQQSFTNSINLPVWSGNANVVLDERYETVLMDAAGGMRYVQLPSAVSGNGRPYTIVKFDSSANIVGIAASGSQTINGATGQALSAAKARMTIVSDGYNWTVTQSGAS